MSDSAVQTIRVLVVDDEPDLRALLRRCLERDGCVVVGEAGDIEQSVQLAEHEQPDVVLLDLQLGEQEGVEAIGPLTRLAPSAMVAVLTSRSAEHQEPEVLKAGAFAFYEKSMLVDLPGYLRDDLSVFARALAGEDVVAPSALTRR